MALLTNLIEMALHAKKGFLYFHCVWFTGVDLSFSVDFDSTPLCQVPDALAYIGEYLYTEGGMEQGPMPEARDSTPQPEPGLDSSSQGASFTTTTPTWTATSTRSLMEGVPPNRCT